MTVTAKRFRGGRRGVAPASLSEFIDRYPRTFFAGPALIAIVALLAFPLGYTAWLSLHQWSGSRLRAPGWVGLGNYVDVLASDSRFWAAFGRTLAFTSAALAVQAVLGVAMAVLLHRELRLRGLLRSAMLLPLIATPVAIALVWRLLFQPDLGLFNQMLQAIGGSGSDWLANQGMALWLLVLVDTWEWTPLIALIVLAGLNALPTEPFEAAEIDRANGWQRFWHITLPMVRPVIVVAIVFRLIDALKTFDIIYVMTQGGPGFATETLNIYIYNTAFQYQRLGYASALLMYFLIIVLGFTLVAMAFRRTKD